MCSTKCLNNVFIDKSLEIIASIKSLPISELLSLPKLEISTMISSANRAFTAMDCHGCCDYTFYWTVRIFIHFNKELSAAETLKNAHSAIFGEVTRRYEELYIEAKNAEEALPSAGANLVKAKEDVACLRQRLEEARSLVVRFEMELVHEESKVVAWESEVGRCSVFHSTMVAEMQRAGSEEEDAKKLVAESNKLCKALNS